MIDKLPKELEDTLFSAETAKNISEICKRNDVQNKTSKIAGQVGYALVGLLPPSEFKEQLIEELGKEKARRVLHEVNRFIFFPVKHSLAEIYKEPTESIGGGQPSETPGGPKTSVQPKKGGEDLYRETVE